MFMTHYWTSLIYEAPTNIILLGVNLKICYTHIYTHNTIYELVSGGGKYYYFI